jgi:capsular polysaccharide biosynthesis protein
MMGGKNTLKKIEMLEKVGGVVTIIVAAVALSLISVFEPPTFVQIICAFVGSIVCLIGVVFLFAEGSIMEERWGKKAPKVK